MSGCEGVLADVSSGLCVTWEWLRGCTCSPPPPPPQAQTTMAGSRQQGSRLRRPWSVYRANTFDLSDEMITMVLTGEGAGPRAVQPHWSPGCPQLNQLLWLLEMQVYEVRGH